MKVLIRGMTLSIIFTILCGIFMQMMTDNIRYDELNTVISSAVSTTQILMKENIADRTYGTHTARRTINSNSEYAMDFKRNLEKLKTTDTDYTIRIYNIDYQKGLIDVGVEATYKTLAGGTKTITARKLNIIDVLE